MNQVLQAGGNVSISNFSGTVIISHDIDARHDINLTAFLLTESGIVQNDNSVVFFNQPRDPNGAATFIAPTQSGNTKTHRIDFDLRKIPSGVSKIAVTLSEENRNSFSSVRNLKAEVRSGSDIVQLNSNSFNTENGIIVLELYVRNNQAKVKSIWQGFTSGLDAICNHYGVNVADNHTDSSISPPTNLSGSSSNNSSNSFHNPNGKLYECESDVCEPGFGKKMFAIVIPIIALITFIIGHQSAAVFFLLLSILCPFIYYFGAREAKAVEGRNENYVIDSINNAFYLPYEDVPLCQLSDIRTVNKGTKKEKRKESYQQSVRGKQKTKYKMVTDYTYYVQIIGAGISQDFEFDEQENRDALYSSLKTGIKEVNDFIRHNYF